MYPRRIQKRKGRDSPASPAGSGKNEPRALSVYQRIRSDIMASKLAPGAVLQEEDLSARLGTSRTPVREALRMLQNDGLVSVIPRRGAAVTEISLRQIIDAYEIRELLEPYAARRGVSRISAGELSQVEELLRRLPARPATLDDILAVDLADEELHDLVARSSGNELLRQTVRQARILTRRAVMLTAAERYARSATEHLAILAAIRQGDGAEAERLLRDHLHRAKDRLLDRDTALSSGLRTLVGEPHGAR